MSSWLLDACLLGFMQLRLARVFTGFLCGVEFWSFLENAARLSPERRCSGGCSALSDTGWEKEAEHE